jgi:hypothetical protein
MSLRLFPHETKRIQTVQMYHAERGLAPFVRTVSGFNIFFFARSILRFGLFESQLISDIVFVDIADVLDGFLSHFLR